MPWNYDLRKDLRFKEGFKVGMEKKARFIAIRILKQGGLTVEQIAEAVAVPLSFVLEIQKELEKNPNLQEKY